MKSQFHIQGNFQLVWPIFFPDKIPYHCDAPRSTAGMSPSYFCSCWQSPCASSQRCGGGKGTISILRLPQLGTSHQQQHHLYCHAHSNTLTVGTNCSVTCQAGSPAKLTGRGRAPTTVICNRFPNNISFLAMRVPFANSKPHMWHFQKLALART